jgi:hypothetical protein
MLARNNESFSRNKAKYGKLSEGQKSQPLAMPVWIQGRAGAVLNTRFHKRSLTRQNETRKTLAANGVRSHWLSCRFVVK